MAEPLAAIVAARTGAGPIMAQGSTAEDMAAGRGPAGIAGARAARSRLALLSACSLRGRLSPTRASRRRRDYAGTTPTQATGRDSGTPASELKAISEPPKSIPRLSRTGGLEFIEIVDRIELSI